MSPTGKKSKSKNQSNEAKRSARCRTCGKRIHVPAGWTVGPAGRRHYWRHHREVMRPDGGGRT